MESAHPQAVMHVVAHLLVLVVMITNNAYELKREVKVALANAALGIGMGAVGATMAVKALLVS